ncbi:MAG TPA: hypothetical protein VEG08_02460 [Terriglobales bacterium]|nr:hypothetical protein [Terriglobales bacterium]
MATPKLSPQQILEVSGRVAGYIAAQREGYLPESQPLTRAQSVPMNGFFLPEVLAAARVVVLNGARVQNPDFYPMLIHMGFTNLPDFSSMAAITFSDVVVSHGVLEDRTLFHELVHVEQYRQLGIQRFAELYVRGFLDGGSYAAIPLEVNAYGLQGRFEQQPHRRYSVADEVAAGIREGRF